MESRSTTNHYDLVVAGAGSGGIGAALAAARQGLTVLLLERGHVIGGNAVRAGVSMWEPGVGGTGIPFDIYRRLRKIPQAAAIYSYGRHFCWPGGENFPGGEHVIDPQRGYMDTLQRYGARALVKDEAFCREHWHGVVFEPFAYARVVGEMLAETGMCTVTTATSFRDVEFADGRVVALTLSTGQRVTADAFVDATGDGVLCQACGCEMLRGPEGCARFGEPSAPEAAGDRVNGVTLMFRIIPTESAHVEALPNDVPAHCWWADNFAVVSMTHYPNGDVNVNMLPTMQGKMFREMGYADVYAECHRRVLSQWHYIQNHYAEFQHCRIAWIAPALGVRETVRVVGEYVLTEHDLRAGLSCQKHADIIALADHAVDHHGEGGGCGELSEPYGVPYRCLIPKGFRNLLIACRAASFSALAASSCRLSRTMMQLGQAAGTAVAQARSLKVDLPEAPLEALRASLRAQHVQLEHPLPGDLRAHLHVV